MCNNIVCSQSRMGVVFVMSALVSCVSMADGIEITSFSGDGSVSWTCPSNGASIYRVEWTPSLGRNWTNFAGAAATLDGMVPTGAEMNATVPMFYRVVADVADYMVVDVAAGPLASNYPVSYLPRVPAGGWTDEYKTTKLLLRAYRQGPS